MSKLTSRQKLLGNNRRYKAEIQALKRAIKFTELINDVRKSGLKRRLYFAYLIIFNKFYQ